MTLAPRTLLFLFLSLPALAQAAESFVCLDYRGLRVKEVPSYRIRDVALANVLPNGQPVIIYHPIVKTAVSQQTESFIYAHECAHHVLGHTAEDAEPVNEQEADCWAIQALYHKGIFNDQDVKIVQAELIATGRADAMHLSGLARAVNLEACLAPLRLPAPIYTAAR
jgi:hypothetical protein